MIASKTSTRKQNTEKRSHEETGETSLKLLDKPYNNFEDFSFRLDVKKIESKDVDIYWTKPRDEDQKLCDGCMKSSRCHFLSLLGLADSNFWQFY